MRRVVRLSLFACGLLPLFLIVLPLVAQQPPPAVHRFSAPYQKWLDEDVRWIITAQERAEFNKLATDQQRDAFIVAFWERRKPNPGATENAFKQEHYRRLAYANAHFAADVPGYRTDRGHLYIRFGQPQSIESRRDTVPPSEIWRYSYMEGIGKDVVLVLVDKCRCSDYRLTEGPIDSDFGPVP
jgi:GWxTD domain-containing protein